MNKEQTIHFKSDDFQLTGTLHLPNRRKPPVVIGCHGLLANRNSPKQISLAQACNAQGIAYFRFDHRGCGQSQGDANKVATLKARCRDLYHAIETMQHNPLVGKLSALFGSSFGGTVILAHAARHQAPALVTYAAPLNSSSIRRANIQDDKGHTPPSSLLTDTLAFDIASELKTVSNILIVHSQNDQTVPVEHAHQIHTTVAPPKRLFIFKDGDHRMSNPNHQQQFKNLFIDWIVNPNGGVK